MRWQPWLLLGLIPILHVRGASGAEFTTAVAITRYDHGRLVAFSNKAIYFSQGDQNVATGRVYPPTGPTGGILVTAITTFGTGVVTAFYDGTVYFSADKSSVGGGPRGTRVRNGSFDRVVALTPLGTAGLVSAFANGDVFYTEDLERLQAQSLHKHTELGVAPGGAPAFQEGLPTHLTTDGSVIYSAWSNGEIFSGDRTKLKRKRLYGPGPYKIQAMAALDHGLCTAFSDGTIHWAKFGDNPGAGTKVYSAGARVTAMGRIEGGVLVGFGDGSVWSAPEGKPLAAYDERSKKLYQSPDTSYDDYYRYCEHCRDGGKMGCATCKIRKGGLFGWGGEGGKARCGAFSNATDSDGQPLCYVSYGDCHEARNDPFCDEIK